MEIDDIAHVFHLGEKLFKRRGSAANCTYDLGDYFEVIQLLPERPGIVFRRGGGGKGESSSASSSERR
jgi:hypothetical protein